MVRKDQVAQLFEQVVAGDRSALGRAITLVESTRPQDRAVVGDLLERCAAISRDSLRIGITGIPGVGKSTLIDALGMDLITSGHRVAVLAVDPSSALSGGSILGDKTRMTRLAHEDAAYIRPSPTGGSLGGVARRTREAIALCEAAGHDRILVETVGVGQSELDVERMTDLTLLLMITGAGDELQGIKRGIMEAADVIVITKVDDQARERAEQARRDLRNAIHLLPLRPNGRHPEVLLTNALTGEGIDGLARHIAERCTADREAGGLEAQRRMQDVHWLRKAIETGLVERFNADPLAGPAMEEAEARVRSGVASPFRAAEELLDRFRTGDAPLP
ncbi:MAG: methylmalonyl Co-A mutase-associated GTPase MeaB [Flavobacteriales bacterium]